VYNKESNTCDCKSTDGYYLKENECKKCLGETVVNEDKNGCKCIVSGAYYDENDGECKCHAGYFVYAEAE